MLHDNRKSINQEYTRTGDISEKRETVYVSLTQDVLLSVTYMGHAMKG